MKWKAVCVFLVAMAIMSAAAALWVEIETQQNPVLTEAFQTADVTTTLAIMDNRPEVENRAFIGDANAPVTIVAYLPSGSKSSAVFLEEVYPVLRQSIEQGAVQYYPRYVVEPADLTYQTTQYWVAKGLACATHSPAFEEFYISSFSVETKEELLNVAATYAIDTAAWQGCLAGEDPHAMLIDLAEGKHFGVGAMHPQVIIGVAGRDTSTMLGIPSQTRLEQVLRGHEVKIGG